MPRRKHSLLKNTRFFCAAGAFVRTEGHSSPPQKKKMPGHNNNNKATSFFLYPIRGEQAVVGCYSSPFDLPDPMHEFRQHTLGRIERARKRDAFLLKRMLPSFFFKEELQQY